MEMLACAGSCGRTYERLHFTENQRKLGDQRHCSQCLLEKRKTVLHCAGACNRKLPRTAFGAAQLKKRDGTMRRLNSSRFQDQIPHLQRTCRMWETVTGQCLSFGSGGEASLSKLQRRSQPTPMRQVQDSVPIVFVFHAAAQIWTSP